MMNAWPFVLTLIACPAEESPWREVAARLERSVVRGDVPEIEAARGLLEAAGGGAGGESDLVRYTIAYAHYRLSVMPSVAEKDRDRHLDAAAGILKKVSADSPRLAEAHALLASVYGMQIGRASFKGMSLGPLAADALERAARLEPDNPRIVLQEALSVLHTPPAYGGSPAKAEALLRRAVALYEREGTGRPWPNWGRSEAHAWLGQVLARRGDRPGARAEYQRALAIEPEFGWVRHVLLPAVEQAGW